MTDRPILFSGPMVRAILAGRKTMTRRVLNPQPPADMGLVGIYAPKLTAVFGYETPDADHKVTLRYMTGDRLWVRESLSVASNDQGKRWLSYAADGKDVWPLTEWHKPRNSVTSIHMPRWASRLTLDVTDVRVQRLQEISEDDAKAEGVEPLHHGYFPYGITTFMTTFIGDREVPAQCYPTAKGSFQSLWDSINVKRPGCAWTDNPWVVAISFHAIKQNIDLIEKEAA